MAKEGQKEFVSKELKLKFIEILQGFLEGIDPDFSVGYEIDLEEERPFESIVVTISPPYADIHTIKIVFGRLLFSDKGMVFQVHAPAHLRECYDLEDEIEKSLCSLKRALRDLMNVLEEKHQQQRNALVHLKRNLYWLDQPLSIT
jgi:hypothetical protein